MIINYQYEQLIESGREFYNKMNTYTVKNKGQMNIEDIVLEGLIAEMGYSSFDIEAYKAQAVAIRTYIKSNKKHRGEGYDLCGTTHCFVLADQKKKDGFTSEQLKKFEQAVKETEGEYIYYNNKIIDSVPFFAYAHNTTNDSKDVWGGGRPYLVEVDTLEKVKPQELIYDRQDFFNKMNIDSLDDIQILDRTYSGYIRKIKINNGEFNGNKLREILPLKSGNFDIYDEGEKIRIVCYGYGHGVGMSQYGANELAKQGCNYKQILQHYYKGVEVKR